MRKLVFGMITLLIIVALPLSAQDFFELNCKLPFKGKAHDVDRECGNSGSTEGVPPAKIAAEEAQNEVKNDLCRKENPKVITIADLMALQHHVDNIPGFHYGNFHTGGFGPPTERQPLKSIVLPGGKEFGEGDVVMFAGFIVEAHYTSSESVNCGFDDPQDVDIHVALGKKAMHVGRREKAADKNPTLCQTITAEAIPHFRPAEWEQQNLETQSDSEVRVTGQLFFDGSHHPRTCADIAAGSTRRDPVRASSWEIHPIYKIEICRKGTGCSITKASDWEPIENLMPEETEEE